MACFVDDLQPPALVVHQAKIHYFVYDDSGGRLEYRATPHGDLVGYRSRIDHMESHEV